MSAERASVLVPDMVNTTSLFLCPLQLYESIHHVSQLTVSTLDAVKKIVEIQKSLNKERRSAQNEELLPATPGYLRGYIQ